MRQSAGLLCLRWTAAVSVLMLRLLVWQTDLGVAGPPAPHPPKKNFKKREPVTQPI